MSGGFAVVLAHPDDDTWGISGTVAQHADDPGFAFTLILATSGDAGEIADGSLATPETLAGVREEEDRASWRTLGREPDRLEFLRYRDGALADADRGELVGRIADILREARPDVVATFGPDGITGHADHVTIGEAATEAFHTIRAEGGSGFSRLLWNVVSQSEIDAMNEWLVASGQEPFDPTQPFTPRGVPDETLGVLVDTSSVWPRKLQALREHRTQADGQGFPDGIWPEVLGRERFVMAWPERAPGAPVLGDVFEAL
ncbi:MAG: PIG-L family deacetylase [Actinomycetota bacterium]